MNRLQIIILVIALNLPIYSMACVEANFELQDYVVKGQAFADGELIYTETLDYDKGDRGGKLKVEYYKASGELLATKKVDFNCRLSAPDFVINDKASNHTEGAKHQDEMIATFFNDESKMLEVPQAKYVIDAGFDHFVKQNWTPLINGERLTAQYLFARDAKFFELRFEQASKPKAIESDDDIVFFKVGADSFLFRLLSSPIYVGYEKDTKRLRYYYGPSNVPAMREYKDVLIVYQFEQ